VDARRRIDLCTCGKPREDAAHDLTVQKTMRGPSTHAFHPNPQPPALPMFDVTFHRISAVRNLGVWIAEVYAPGKIGRGQARTWLAAVEAAHEDLQEKKS
jgi:hypothetical protein